MKINFGGSRPWGAVSLKEYQRYARDPRHALFYRVHFAAIGWANRIGHAEFAPGGLAAILADEQKRPVNASSLSRAISQAKVLDLIGPTSRARCLVLPRHQFQNEGHGSRSCRTHGVRTAG